LQGVANTLCAQGFDLAALSVTPGLSVGELDDPEHWWPTEEVNRLWALAVERSGNSAVALSIRIWLDRIITARSAMPRCRVLICSRGLERLIRYLRIVSDAVSISLDRQAKIGHRHFAKYGYRLDSALIPPERVWGRQRRAILMTAG